MKLYTITIFLFGVLLSNSIQSQTCSSSIIKQYTSTPNLVNFTDNSVPPSNWQRDYTNWNYNDGSPIDTGLNTSHIFPQAQSYNVYKETKYSEIGNPTNFCLATNSLVIDASLSSPTSVCYPTTKFKVKWLTGLTYGVSSYYSGCSYLFKEIVVDTGYFTSISSTGSPISGIFSTNQNFFTYTLPAPPYVYAFIYHVNSPDPNNSNGFTPGAMIYTVDSIPSTPLDCHASFFLQPSDSSLHNWTLQDYSSSSDSLSYLWDFGDGNTSTLSNPSYTYSSVGIYTICLTVSSGTCSDTYCETAFVDTTVSGSGIHSINVQKMLVTGISKNKKQEQAMLLFPNPAHNSIDISYPFKKENYSITVTDLLGQSVLNQTINDISTSTVKLNIEDLKSGMYLLQIHSDSGTTLAKTRFIKE